jgi:predicted oxidoreductase
MERISLNKEVSLSRIVYGMWRLGDDENTSPEHVRAKIDASLDQGITSFDQADIYGGYEAEEILGMHCLDQLCATKWKSSRNAISSRLLVDTQMHA